MKHAPALFASVLMTLAASAGATVPGQVQYQGLLLDDLGDPINGNVALVFELFDAASGGTSLWTESHATVSVLDGVYEVPLGSVSPILPSTLSGGAVFLEIEVDGETLVPRQQLLAVPYSLLASEAESAASVGGFSSTFTTEMFEHFDFDGGAPPNDDPSEGIGDADSDGIANFVDADNDNDGLSDVAELAQSSDINLPTPIVTGVAPSSARACLTTTVDISGSNFDAGATVDFGSESPVPNSVTPTNIEVDVGPQTPGVVGATVTNPNLETDTLPTAFSFDSLTPTITGFSPNIAAAADVTTIEVQGTNFEPGLAVQFGSQTPTPTNVTPTSFSVDVGPQALGPVTVTVTNVCGEQDSDGTFSFPESSLHIAFVSSVVYVGGGIAAADAQCASLASAAGLLGTYLAWLSDGVVDPASRFTQLTTPYARTDDVVIAEDWADLTDGTIDAFLERDENGDLVADASVYSNVGIDGTTYGTDVNSHCDGWTASTGMGRIGNSSRTPSGWTNASTINCLISARLYCFQQ